MAIDKTEIGQIVFRFGLLQDNWTHEDSDHHRKGFNLFALFCQKAAGPQNEFNMGLK